MRRKKKSAKLVGKPGEKVGLEVTTEGVRSGSLLQATLKPGCNMLSEL